ncbi:universal stress protein/MT2061 [bacterium BMS3Abin05]|nr:universal stress protein/MT2061 [bacterium BMS3Abin05]HDZ13190.1 universal stress protein [Bacteroidota bacterium]
MIKSLLVGVDGSEYTNSVLKYSIKMAHAFDAKLRVITVIDVRIFEWSVYMGVDGFAPVFPSSIYLDESRNLLNQKAKSVLDKCKKILDQEKISYTVEKVDGSPVDIICEKANVTDMIVMGAHGEFARWGTKMMGATTESISRQCEKPLFVAQKKVTDITKILVPYDGSRNSNKALPMAGFFSSKFNAPVTIFTVDNKNEMAESIANEGKEYLSAYNIPVDIQIHKGNPDEEIVRFSKNGFDLIIMGAYGHSRIKEAILGSTTEHVMRNAKIPVLLMK